MAGGLPFGANLTTRVRVRDVTEAFRQVLTSIRFWVQTREHWFACAQGTHRIPKKTLHTRELALAAGIRRASVRP